MSGDDVPRGVGPGAPVTPQKEEAEPAPFGEKIPFNLSVPPLHTTLVDATVLEEYEIWVFWTSVLSSAFVGFLVAYIQSTTGKSSGSTASLVISIFLGLLTLLAGIRAVVLRRRLAKSATNYPMVAVPRPPSPSGEERDKPST